MGIAQALWVSTSSAPPTGTVRTITFDETALREQGGAGAPIGELGLPLVGDFYNNDPVYLRTDRKDWNVQFTSPNPTNTPIALEGNLEPPSGGSGNFDNAYTIPSAIVTVSEAYFTLVMTSGKKITSLEFRYTTGGTSALADIKLYDGGTLLLTEAISDTVGYAWNLFTSGYSFATPVDSVRFSSIPNRLVVDQIVITVI